ncbi:peptide-methionine (S)-S-oxide reductase [Salinivibrio kushneri]|uniref:Peptide methionine sulfoxide reductase MsrA n=2 Tax=Salinivibrio kushneri TaxID=1908198 RepID=A0AB36K7Z3_9GAMM|nr:peptide-methionine (S)-S-oxide reductase MsrA [Salinivibrio kushneri]OOE44523.1 peptide-methionine (S)-S-oxide reductase [Salinivibrio kushneri]OOE46880.1 peptide-methionine (S)-S-oxide reductase [Salinivibrio kushneri]
MPMSMQSSFTQPDNAIADRPDPIIPAEPHAVFNQPITAMPASGQKQVIFGMGCFWGAERKWWQQPGVVMTSVGYSGGVTQHPRYQDVCTGQTGHAEVVNVIFDPSVVSLDTLLAVFWENHDPTQGMRQGNDVGPQYRSAIYYCNPADQASVEASLATYQAALRDAGKPDAVTTEIAPAGAYYFAETDHQQYLHKNPQGYCGLGGTGVCFPPQ